MWIFSIFVGVNILHKSVRVWQSSSNFVWASRGLLGRDMRQCRRFTIEADTMLLVANMNIWLRCYRNKEI